MPVVSPDILQALAIMERRRVITTDPNEKEECCGMPRDPDGFCQHRPSHPVYISITISS